MPIDDRWTTWTTAVTAISLTIQIVPMRTVQQSHLNPHLSNLTFSNLTHILHLSPLYPAHWKVCRSSWAIRWSSVWVNNFFFSLGKYYWPQLKGAFLCFWSPLKTQRIEQHVSRKSCIQWDAIKTSACRATKKEVKLFHDTVWKTSQWEFCFIWLETVICIHAFLFPKSQQLSEDTFQKKA